MTLPRPPLPPAASRFEVPGLIVLLALACAPLPAQDKPAQPPGAVIYKKLCAECHGDRGQGVEDEYDDALTGEKSLEALAKYIDRTMPDDDPGKCDAAESRQVAEYIFSAFYSPEAQARLHPPRKDLSRLTIDQFRQSVMDVMARFRGGPGVDRPAGPEQGLRGSYRGFEPLKEGDKLPKGVASQRAKNRVKHNFDRVDGRVAFHFGADSPEPGKMGADEFRLEWSGSIVAPETGTYEFAVKTENGFRLWVNDEDEGDPLIDGWVSAGPKVREEKKSIFLLGGRSYFLRLEHFKFQEQSSSIELWWKPPHGIKEIIPAAALRADRSREMLVVTTDFPPDDSSGGYARGTTISKAWDQAVTEAAIGVAENVVEDIDKLSGSKPGAPDRGGRLRKFAQTFVETALRRPPGDELKQAFIESQFETAKSPETAVKRIVLFTLKSPQFLYPNLREVENEKPDDFDIASRLALTLWDSVPDKKLTQAAAAGKLHTREQVKAEAQRMIADARTKEKVRGFFHKWLEFERAEGTSKDPKVFPDFTPELLADLRESLMEFIDQVVWGGKSDYRELLQADYLLLNERLGKFYGKPVSGDAFQRVSFDPKQRAGVITHPYLLASLAYTKQTSPIHRGVFLTRNVVGMSLKPPMKAVVFEDSHFNPALTMREKISDLTRSEGCMSCHRMINPLGFSLENFDAVGRWRTKDNNKPVNAVTDFATDEGRTVHLTGPRDIVNYVSDNPSGHRAFIRHLFHHLIKQEPAVFGAGTLDTLQKSFASGGCHIQKLLVEIALTAAMDGVE